MKRAQPTEWGTAMIVTLLTLSALSLMAATAAVRIYPRLPIAYQNAAWEESRVAAEAGIDAGMADLLRNATGPAPNAWPGWQESRPGALDGVKNLVNSLVSPLGLGGLTSSLLNALLGGPTGVTSSDPIYLDNLRVSAPGGIPAEVDVQLWALQNAADANHLWFRIRSTATCALPPIATTAPEKLDPALRKLSLRSVRPSLRKDMPGAPSTVAVPNVTRTMEVLVEPILPFELAVWTTDSLSLAATGSWNIDSYDSSSLQKSNAGLYPGRGSAATQTNGHVACSKARPAASLYGPLIQANGTRVAGAVATNGGDDPATATHENVSNTIGLDLDRVRNDFSRLMSPVPRPGGAMQGPPLLGTYMAGPAESPAKYHVAGSLTSLRIVASPFAPTNSLIVICVDGALDLSGPLIIPPGVTCVLFVKGNITFRDSVNAGPWNTNRPGQLLIFADGPADTHQRLDALGDQPVCAAFYGPQCDVFLSGEVNWSGSLAARTFQVSGGGDGGVHFDEALARLGPPISFRIIRCVEDVRE